MEVELGEPPEIDDAAETAAVLTASGAVGVLSVSSAPRIAVRLGGRVHGEPGAGARLGIARMRGEALPGSRLIARPRRGDRAVTRSPR